MRQLASALARLAFIALGAALLGGALVAVIYLRAVLPPGARWIAAVAAPPVAICGPLLWARAHPRWRSGPAGAAAVAWDTGLAAPLGLACCFYALFFLVPPPGRAPPIFRLADGDFPAPWPALPLLAIYGLWQAGLAYGAHRKATSPPPAA